MLSKVWLNRTIFSRRPIYGGLTFRHNYTIYSAPKYTTKQVNLPLIIGLIRITN